MPRASQYDTELVGKILKLYYNLHTAKQIGEALGLTKNQVIGILHRVKAQKVVANKKKVGEYLRIAHKPVPKVISSEGLPLLECPDDGCRYSIGEDENGLFLFCAKQSLPNTKYCKKHYDIVYVPANRFRRVY